MTVHLNLKDEKESNITINTDGITIFGYNDRLHLTLNDEQLDKLQFAIASYLQDRGK